jgi:RNA polymerase sigma-70 factor (ECF subfamily)
MPLPWRRRLDSAAARTSASLLARVGGSGDADAWRDFVRRYGPQVLGWCRHWRLQEADAEDVAQDVLLRVAKQMQTFRYDAGRSFRAWLKTVTRAAWSDWLDARRRSVGAGTGDTAARSALETVAAQEDLMQRIDAEFDRELFEVASQRVRLRIESQTWEAFRLTAIDGLSGAEAAERLGMKVATVFVVKGRVQQMLRDEVLTLDRDG